VGILLRKLVIRALLPQAWGRDRHCAAASLKRFGNVEADSAWQYHQALCCSTDAELKRMLFENMLEEFDHADRFRQVANKLSSHRLYAANEERVQLIEREGDLAPFLAYVHLSEKDIHGQFETYAKVCGIKEVANVFSSVREDEANHEAQARRFLLLAAGSEAAATRAILRARLRRAKETWVCASKSIGQVSFSVILIGVFLVFGMIGRRPCSKVSSEAGRVVPRSESAGA